MESFVHKYGGTKSGADTASYISDVINEREGLKIFRPLGEAFLNEKYGYDIVAEYERGEETDEPWLIHMYCIYDGKDGETIYVDARGKCTDYSMFMEKFLGDGSFCDESRKYKEIHKMIPDEYRVRNDNWKYYNAKKLDCDLCCYAPDA